LSWTGVIVPVFTVCEDSPERYGIEALEGNNKDNNTIIIIIIIIYYY